ncbi:C-C motif chemokine 27a [Denticeps clupeoides]|uniref:C-C motif chemokine 27a n=1 Tax=Denticeps clupeoides TaxID=299321 RepID=UPI0010A2DB18|nr:C-C motif chemokine 28 [Denticeps clupeoides]
MDLRVACLLLFLSATFIGTEGGPKCCLSVSRTIPDNILLKVKTHSLQTTSGECDINAIILHTERKRFCAPLKILSRLQKLMKYRNRKSQLNK